jgi:ABC-type branched-subunit amino acid transport system substrate-binding protein
MVRGHGWRRGAVALTAAATVGLAVTAGCGPKDASAAAGGDCNAPGFTANEIKLGFVYPDTGPLHSIANATRSGVEARIELANDRGGIHGRKITYVWRDDASDPKTNGTVVRELIEKVGVFGLIEMTAVAGGGASYLRDHDVPVTGMALEPFWAEPRFRNMFAYGYLYTGGTVDTFGRYVRAQGGTRAAVIGNDTSGASQGIGAKIKDSLVAGGVAVIPHQFVFNPNVGSARDVGEQIRAAGADVLTGAVSPTDFAAVLNAVQAAGGHIKVALSANGYDRSLLQQDGASLAGLTTFATFVPFEANTPAQQTYRTAMARYAPELQPPDQEMALRSYIYADLFLRGLEVAGRCPTRAGFINALRAVHDYDAGGLLAGQVDLTKDFGRLNTCYIFVRVNATGTGYDVVENNTPGFRNRLQWCGEQVNGQ